MSLTITLLDARRFGGVEVAANASVTVADALAAELVAQGIARYGLPASVVDASMRDYPAATYIPFGDSITDDGTFLGAVGPVFTHYSYWGWFQRLNGHRLEFIRNAGIGGQRSYQLLARMDADVMAFSPGWVSLLVGTNDICGDNASADTTFGYIRAIVERIRRSGARVVLMTIWPRSDAGANLQSARAQIVRCNEMLREYARVMPGVHLVDAWAVLADPNPALTTNFIKERANTLRDSLHPSSLGAYLVGKEMHRVITPLIPGNDNLIASSSDTYDGNSVVPNILGTESLFLGTTKAATSPITGTEAARWLVQRQNGTPDAVLSVPARADGLGNYQQLACTFNAAGDQLKMIYTGSALVGRITSGEWFQAECAIEVDAGHSGLRTVSLQARAVYTDASENGGYDGQTGTDPLPVALPNEAISFVLKTPWVQVDTTKTLSSISPQLFFVASAAGTATIRVSRYRLRKAVFQPITANSGW